MSRVKKTRPVLLSTASLSPRELRLLRASAPEYRVVCRPAKSYAETDAAMDDSVEIVYANYAPMKLERSANLKWVHLASVGINHLSHSPVLTREDIVLTNSRGTMSVSMAEFTLAAILSLARDFPKAFELQARRGWIHNNDRMEHFPAPELRGRRLGLLGYGSVAQEIARLAHAIGMKVSALSTGASHSRERRYVIPELRRQRLPKPDRWYRGLSAMRKLLAESDVVVNTLPLTPTTKEVIGLKEFRVMKPTSYFINVSRGPVIDEPALLMALERKWISRALLDVFSQEPLPSDSPLFATPGLAITPHISGISVGMSGRMLELFLENLSLYRAGRTLYNVVERKRGY